eukprot:m.186675 g.186675  ORF g.186675 m.186675 type:complete len:397 (-) comp32275_c4_seq8:168-1358(-)
MYQTFTGLLFVVVILTVNASSCGTCESLRTCLTVDHIANPAKAAYRVTSCNGMACDVKCSWSHIGSAKSFCNDDTHQYKLVGCTPIHAMRGPARLRSFWGKPNVTIYHLHTRKAAGTTLDAFLTKVALALGWKLHSYEGNSLSKEILVEMRKTGIIITSLRDPISRIHSAYKFEGRWKLRTLHYAWMKNNTMVNNSVIDRTFKQYWDEATTGHVRKSHFGPTSDHRCFFSLWTCVASCYLRKYSNNNCTKEFEQIEGNEDALVERALDTLDAIDFTIITEELSNSDYQQRLEREFIIPKISSGNEIVRKQSVYESIAMGHTFDTDTQWESDPHDCNNNDQHGYRWGCFVKLVRRMPVTSGVPRPDFEIEDFWHPIIKQANAIDTSIFEHYRDTPYF